MKKKLLGAIFLSFALVALAACGSDKTSDQPAKDDTTTEQHPETEKVQGTQEPTGNVVEVTINATNFEFDKKEIKAKVGDTIKLTVVNESGAHGVAIDGYDVDVKGGETKEFVADKAGEFDYYCSVMCGTGHDNMTGKLIVSE